MTRKESKDVTVHCSAMTHDATELTESEVGSLEIVNDSVIKCFRRAMATTFLVVCNSNIATSFGEVREVREVRVSKGTI